MQDSEVLKALEAAFTGYERNNNAALLELLSDDFTFEMSDSLPYGGAHIGRGGFLRFLRGGAKEGAYFPLHAHEIIHPGGPTLLSVKNPPPPLPGLPLPKHRPPG